MTDSETAQHRARTILRQWADVLDQQVAFSDIAVPERCGDGVSFTYSAALGALDDPGALAALLTAHWKRAGFTVRPTEVETGPAEGIVFGGVASSSTVGAAYTFSALGGDVWATSECAEGDVHDFDE